MASSVYLNYSKAREDSRKTVQGKVLVPSQHSWSLNVTAKNPWVLMDAKCTSGGRGMASLLDKTSKRGCLSMRHWVQAVRQPQSRHTRPFQTRHTLSLSLEQHCFYLQMNLLFLDEGDTSAPSMNDSRTQHKQMRWAQAHFQLVMLPFKHEYILTHFLFTVCLVWFLVNFCISYDFIFQYSEVCLYQMEAFQSMFYSSASSNYLPPSLQPLCTGVTLSTVIFIFTLPKENYHSVTHEIKELIWEEQKLMRSIWVM